MPPEKPDKPEKKVALGPLAEQIAENIRRIRESRRLSYALIAERLEEVGRPIPVLGLRRIERGDRRVDVDDLVALAYVLAVPPILLIFPLGQSQEIELLPDRSADTWSAVKWFTGDRPLFVPRADRPYGTTFESPDAARQWQGSMAPLAMYEEHDRLTGMWAAATIDAQNNVKMADGAVSEAARDKFLAEADEAQRQAQALERELALHRHYMRRHGVDPEPLRDGLRDLDEDRLVYPDSIGMPGGGDVRVRMVQDDQRAPLHGDDAGNT